jgi:TolA-binding protein
MNVGHGGAGPPALGSLQPIANPAAQAMLPPVAASVQHAHEVTRQHVHDAERDWRLRGIVGRFYGGVSDEEVHHAEDRHFAARMAHVCHAYPSMQPDAAMLAAALQPQFQQLQGQMGQLQGQVGQLQVQLQRVSTQVCLLLSVVRSAMTCRP